MLDEAGYAKEGRIAVTQPRRVVGFCTPSHEQNAMDSLRYAGRTQSNSKLIICLAAQAALSVARRVAEEMDTDVGAEVGYSVRFDERTSSRTRIVYQTGDHFLLT